MNIQNTSVQHDNIQTPQSSSPGTVSRNTFLQDIIALSKKQITPTLILDKDLCIQFINDAAYRLFDGYYTLENKPLFNVFGNIFTQTELRNFFAYIRSKEKGYSWIGNISHKTRRLKTLHTRVRVHPVFDIDEEHSGYWLVFEDITDQNLETYKIMLSGLLQASKLKDNDTGFHAERLNFYCKGFAEYLFERNIYPQINKDFIENISFLAAIHDIGKIGTPDYILQKQSKLVGVEWEIMKEHTINGALIVASYPITMAKEIALSHHERWDGSGYPFKLEGEMIPLAARLVAIADVYDALRMKRPYKEGFSHEDTIQYIIQDSGKHFDPNLIEHFKKIHPAFNETWNNLKDDQDLS
ncbi:MAG: HD-GYP domain-containing protein [Treponema phagedenis]|uniref:HD-GYP domain-containing protein n=1 Tax=Treponema phagedenis TaxID=162 RepID=UPI003134214A